MSAAGRVGLFVTGLALAFGAAFLLGGALDPEGADEDAPTHGGVAAHGDEEHSATTAAGPARIVVEDADFEPGARKTLTFRVVDRDGRTVRDFDVEHERAMHVIAVRHDLTGYRHLHPRRTPDGGWAVDVAFTEAGPQRVFADFVSRGEPHTLFADVTAAGRYAPRPLPAPSTRADAGDGYAVTAVADGGERRYTATKDGVPVDDIEPYLGARGHLVALRESDLEFQHVHPKNAATEGREIGFDVALEGDGRHRLFLQFKHAGEVRTAAFTELAGDPDVAPAESRKEDGHGH
jgi:hypothetical protein